MGILDDGECGGCGWCIGGEETAGEISGHIIVDEGAVWVEGDSARSSFVLFPFYKVAGFSRLREHDFLFSLVGASSFEFVCDRGDESREVCRGGWVGVEGHSLGGSDLRTLVPIGFGGGRLCRWG